MEIRTDCLPEAMAYLGKVERVNYHHAGSPELAKATSHAAHTSKALLLNNHGAVCRGSSLSEALLITETLEFLCRLLIASNSGGIELDYLGEEVMKDFRRSLEIMGG